jgi:hypothetical protein
VAHEPHELDEQKKNYERDFVTIYSILPIRQNGSLLMKATGSRRRTALAITTLPSASTARIWKTDLAKPTPTVAILSTDDAPLMNRPDDLHHGAQMPHTSAAHTITEFPERFDVGMAN